MDSAVVNTAGAAFSHAVCHQLGGHTWTSLSETYYFSPANTRLRFG